MNLLHPSYSYFGKQKQVFIYNFKNYKSKHIYGVRRVCNHIATWTHTHRERERAMFYYPKAHFSVKTVLLDRKQGVMTMQDFSALENRLCNLSRNSLHHQPRGDLLSGGEKSRHNRQLLHHTCHECHLVYPKCTFIIWMTSEVDHGKVVWTIFCV